MPDPIAPPVVQPAPAATISLVSPQGDPTTVPASDEQFYLRQGFTPDTADRAVARVGAATRAEQVNPIEAFGQGVGRTVTLGGSDVLQRIAGGEDARIYLEQLQRAHPLATTAGELAGMFVPAGAAGAAGRAGRAVAELGEGGGIAGRLIGGALGGATEGAIYGAGQATSDLALSPDALTVEHIGSTLSSNMLYGAGVGGVLGGVGRAAELGLQRARGAVQDFAERQAAAQQLVNTGGAVEADLAGLDAKGLRAARETELDRLADEHAQTRAAARSAAADDAVSYRQTFKESDPWVALGDMNETAPLYKSGRTLRNAMDDVKGLRENPAPLLKPLRVEEQALEGAISNREAIAAKMEAVNQKIATELGEDLATLPAKATTVDLTGKAARRYGSFADVKVPRDGSVSIARDEAHAFLGALQRGEVTGQGQQALAALPDLLEQNRALQLKIKDATAPAKLRSELTSERLGAIESAHDVLRAGKPKTEPTPGAKLLGHVGYGATVALLGHIPVVGHALGAVVGSKVADLITGAMGKLGGAATEASKRAATAAASFLDVASKGAARAPIATRVLAALRYGPGDQHGEEEPRDLPGLYKRRTDEIKRQIQIAQDGSFQMTEPARAAMAKNFDGIRPKDPILADRLETHAARKIAWLGSQIPRMPDAFGSSLGPVKWQPSDLEMRSFARKLDAAEDPIGVLERVASGHVTPEDVITMTAVYPEVRNAYIADVTARIGTLRKTLPYERRLSMSIFSGVPVDPAMHPAISSVLQGQFAAEIGSMGGTQAPKPQPQMGSLKKSPDAPTPAQIRSQGAHL